MGFVNWAGERGVVRSASVWAQFSGILHVLDVRRECEVSGEDVPVFGVVGELAGVAGAGVGSCDPAGGEVQSHEFVHVVDDEHIAIEHHHALHQQHHQLLLLARQQSNGKRTSYSTISKQRNLVHVSANRRSCSSSSPLFSDLGSRYSISLTRIPLLSST